MAMDDKLPRTKEKYPTVTTRPSNLLPSPTSKMQNQNQITSKSQSLLLTQEPPLYRGHSPSFHQHKEWRKKKSHFRKETVGEGKYTSHTFHFRKVKRGRRGEAIKRCCCRQIHCWEVKRMKEREKVVRLAKLAEQAERYDGMAGMGSRIAGLFDCALLLCSSCSWFFAFGGWGEISLTLFLVKYRKDLWGS